MKATPHHDDRPGDARRLFFSFLKIGTFTFGGGYAMLPLLEREGVEKHQWASREEVVEIFGIAQAVPGVIAVNVATMVGYRVRGVAGSAAAVLGVATPSLVFMSLVALFFERFQEWAWVGYAFQGARAGVVVLVLGALRRMCRNTRASVFNFCVGCAAFAATAFFQFSAAWVVLTALAIGLLSDVFTRARAGEARDV